MRVRYLQSSNKHFLFNPDIEYFVLKTDREKGRRPYFIIFAFWSALIVTGWWLMRWSRKSYLRPNEIFLFLVLFKDGGRKVGPRFYFFISGVNQGNEEARWGQDLLVWPTGMERFFLDPGAVKKYKEYPLAVEYGCVVRPWVHRICNRRLMRVKILWIDHLRLEQAMRNLTCGDQEILVAVIWMALTKVKTEKTSY